MTNTQTHQFSGMLNQHEFKERYIFMMQRIANGFSREDLAFLLGRSSYHVIDFEEFSDKIKMNYEDYEAMATLFRTSPPPSPAFNAKVNNLDISAEKRMIRGTYRETNKERHHQFIHPWTIKGVNTPITITENIQRNAERDAEIKQHLTAFLSRCIGQNIFNHKTSALKIYHHVYIALPGEWRPSFIPPLKQVVYEFILTEKLMFKNEQGHIFYQTKL